MAEDTVQTNFSPANNSTRLLDVMSGVFFVMLLIIGLVTPFIALTRIIIVLGAALSLVIYLAVQRFSEGGPYNMASMQAIRLWPVAIILAVIVVATGGVLSPLLLILVYPVVVMSLQFGSRESLKVTGLTLATVFVVSLVSASARIALASYWSSALLQSGLLVFLSYYLSYLADALIQTQTHLKNIDHLDQEKSEFIGLASHHLRTPLTAMKGYVDFLLGGLAGGMSDEQRQIAGRLESSVNKVESLVENLLMASSMENGKIPIHRRLGDFGQLLKSCTSGFAAAMDQKGLRFVVEIPDLAGEPILFDANRLREAINNLLANALKFTKTGFVKFSVQSEPGIVHVQVTDSGIGIADTELPHLFQKFVRGDSIMGAWNQEGAGLGLYITRLIVEAHGGQVSVVSEVGQGSQFAFSLPKRTA